MAYSIASASSQSLDVASAPGGAVPITIAYFNKLTLTGAGKASGIKQFNTSTSSRFLIVVDNSTPVIQSLDSSGGFENVVAGSVNTSNVYHFAGIWAANNSRTIRINATTTATGTNPITVGTLNSTTVFGDATFAEFGIWNVALTVDEITSLSKGFKPHRIRPQSLVFYAPLVRNLQDVDSGVTITNNNSATVANHPRVY